MKKFDIEQTAYQSRLQIVEVTQGMNGYPKGIYKAIVGFESFEDAECIANKKDLEIVVLRSRDGWQFFENLGRTYSPFDEYAAYPSDEYDHYTNISFDGFCAQEDVQGTLATAGDFDEMLAMLENFKEIFEQIENLGSDEVAVIHRESGEGETIKKEYCHYHYDVWRYEIALVEKA
jgi:hypothetical protein